MARCAPQRQRRSEEPQCTRRPVARPQPARRRVAAVSDADPVRDEVARPREPRSRRLVDDDRRAFLTATCGTRATGSGVSYIVEQETAADEAGNRTAGSAEHNAVSDWDCLVSGSIEVLPAREADTKLVTDVLAVDIDTNDVVVLARNELDPELDGVNCVATVEARSGVRHEVASGWIGSVVDHCPNPTRRVNQANARHSSTSAVVRSHGHVQARLLSSRLGGNE